MNSVGRITNKVIIISGKSFLNMSQITKSFGYFCVIMLGIQLEPTQNIELISNYGTSEIDLKRSKNVRLQLLFGTFSYYVGLSFQRKFSLTMCCQTVSGKMRHFGLFSNINIFWQL